MGTIQEEIDKLNLAVKKVPSYEELKKLAPKEDEFSKEAMNNLSLEVKKFLDVNHQAEFLEKLCLLAEKKDFIFNKYVIFGIVQLAHYKHENLSGSKRKGFQTNVIPFLMGIKEKVLKKEMTSEEIKKIIIKKVCPWLFS